MPPKPSVKLIDPDAVKVRDVPYRYGPGYDLSIVRPKKKKNINLEDVMPTGIDNGKGAQTLMNSYVDEVCQSHPRRDHALINFDILSDDFRNKPFLEQIKHVQMKNIPLLSQVARQDAMHPHNSTKKKKHYIEYSKRLLNNDSGLIRARLSSEFLDDTVIKMLASGLEKNTVLQHLALHKNAISDEGVETLCLALRWHPMLHTLWLGANRYTDIGARHLALLLQRNRNIKELNISNRWPSQIWQKNEYELHPHVTYIGAQYLAKALHRGAGLTSLSLSDQRIRDDGAIYLFEAIQHCNLRALNLRANELTDRCCAAFRTALECNTVLEHVILSHNQIGNDGAITIAYGLARNTYMRCLDVGYNKLGSIGLDALHLCLKYNHSLCALITVRNLDDDTRAEDLVASRATVFGFGAAAGVFQPSATQGRRLSSGGSVSSREGTSPSKPGLRRMSSSTGKTVLALDLTVPDSVEIMGKSVHSRSFRSVQIDSLEASRGGSFRSNSFKALSQKFETDSDGGHSTARSDHSAEGYSKPSSPAPMLGGGRPRHTIRPGEGKGLAAGSPHKVSRTDGSPAQLRKSKSVKIISEDGKEGGGDGGGSGAEDSKAAPKLARSSSSKKFFSFRKYMDSEEANELPTLLRAPPPAMFNPGRPVRSRDVGKTISIPNLKNMGVRPIRTSISSQKDSAQHLMYLRIATPFDPPDERPYSILKVGQDYIDEGKRVRAKRQHAQYKFDKAFKINNTPKVIKHQAALPKVPTYFWQDWHSKIRLQYIEGIDNAPGVTSTKLEAAPVQQVEDDLEAHYRAAGEAAAQAEAHSAQGSRASSASTLALPPIPVATAGKPAVAAAVSTSAKFSGSVKLSGSAKLTPSAGSGKGAAPENPMNDPNSAYYLYSNDPSQSYRRHLTFKNNGVTPGKILAARRKENAIKRAQKLAEEGGLGEGDA